MNSRAGLASILVFGVASAFTAEEHSQHQERAEPQMDRQSHTEHPHEGHAAHDHAAHGADSTQPGESERAHVPPEPPQHVMGDMSVERMIELMQMEDDAPFGMLLLDQLEWQKGDDADAMSWEFDAWFGGDYHKLWFETEGVRSEGEATGRVEVMWDRIISPWWSIQTGVRHDFGPGPSRTWADFGVQGTAPYFLEVDAAIYIGEQGRTALRFSGEYDVLITQRLVLQPEIEIRAYGKDDPENGIGSGLSDLEFGLRLRYEVRREIAPYLGVHWERRLGQTADFARAQGEKKSEVAVVAGIRAWF